MPLVQLMKLTAKSLSGSVKNKPFMAIEIKPYPISNEIASQAIERSIVQQEDFSVYLHRNMRKMRLKYPPLRKHILGNRSNEYFGLYLHGSCTFFDAIDSQLEKDGKELVVTPDDIEVGHRNRDESIVSANGDVRTLKMRWVLDKVEKSSMVLALFLNDAAEDIKGEEAHYFVFGFLETASTFYSKLEAEQFNQHFFGRGPGN